MSDHPHDPQLLKGVLPLLLLELLAQREERTLSDTLRRLIRQAMQSNERAPAAKPKERH